MNDETEFFNYAFTTVWCIFLLWYWDIEPSFIGLPSAAMMFGMMAANKAVDLMRIE